jgi:PQQ-dependent dehydrogenase (methanol/ethanol family)
MARRHNSIRNVLLAGGMLAAWPVLGADVTPERLLNPDMEPQNWLMNHRSYDGQRFSPLDKINKGNVKGLKLAYAVALGGGAGNEFTNATPLAEDGFLYITDSWNVLYKIDATSGDVGRIVWRMDPKQDRQMRSRGAALSGNLVITGAGGFGNSPRIIATDKETGKVVWETSFSDTPDVTFTAAPLAIKDKIIVGAANGDQGVRDWIGALDAKSGKRLWRQFIIPAPGEPGSDTWKGNTNAWQTGGGAVWVTGTYDPATNQTIWGTGNPVPMFDPTYRPGDNLYTNSAISWDPDTGKMNWYFQFTPGDMWDYDEVGTHILIDSVVAGQPRKLITHSARNGFLYTMERANGAMVLAKPYMEVNWTKGIDQKTGRPVDYDPAKDIQTYAGIGPQSERAAQEGLSVTAGRQQLLAEFLQFENQAPVHPSFVELLDDYDRPGKAQQGEGLEWRPCFHPRTVGKRPEGHRPADRRDQEERAPELPEFQRHAHNRRRARISRDARWHSCGFRRYHARRIVENQRRFRLFRAADDLRSQRQAVHRDRVGAEPGFAKPARQLAGAQGAAQCARALRVRTVSRQ